jgi:acetyl esterase/lipase
MTTNGRRVASLLIVLLACGCADDGSSSGSVSGAVAASLVDSSVPYATGLALDVHRPSVNEAPEPLPVVVQVHGCCGDRADLTKLAEAMASRGSVVFNVDWSGMDADARYPEAYGDVACAVRFARTHAAHYGGDPQRVALLGWSDDALGAAVVALRGDAFESAPCTVKVGSAVPDLLVGVAGFYGWTLPVPSAYATERVIRFLGGPPSDAVDAWHDATPHAWIGQAPSLPALLLVGVGHPLHQDASGFATAWRTAGDSMRVVSVEYAGDASMISPRTLEGRTTVDETISALQRLESLPDHWAADIVRGVAWDM